MDVRRTALGLLPAGLTAKAIPRLYCGSALKDPGALDPGALGALGRYYGDDPEVKAFLLARARDDSDEKHRAAALLRCRVSSPASRHPSSPHGSPPGVTRASLEAAMS